MVSIQSCSCVVVRFCNCAGLLCVVCFGAVVYWSRCGAVYFRIGGAEWLFRYDCSMYSCSDTYVKVCSVKLYRFEVCSYFVVRFHTC